MGDAREFLGALSEKLGDTRLEPEAGWYQEVRKTHEEYREEVDAIADKETIEGTGLINEAALARTLSEALPEDTITIYDGGQIMEWTHTFIRPRDPWSFGFAPGMGHLGFGLPFANAAKLNFPDRPVVVITGDGAMGMTGQEMETAVRYGLNVVAVVANDSCWGMYRPFGEEIFKNRNFGTNTGNVDFAKVAEGYGAAGYRVEELADVKPALAEALAAGRPAVVDVVCDFMPHPIDAFWPGVILKGMDLSPVEC